MDTNAMQLHEKVQKLIEQYTLDKKRMAELETALIEKSNDNEALLDKINKIQTELQTALNQNAKLTQDLNDINKKNEELDYTISSIELFANDLNSRIDDLIPKIEKL